MQFENLKAVIDFAIESEKVAAAFYDEVSEKEPFAGSKEMLKEFAAEERKHQALLEKFLTEGVDQSVAEYELKWVTDIKRSNYVVEMEYEEGTSQIGIQNQVPILPGHLISRLPDIATSVVDQNVDVSVSLISGVGHLLDAVVIADVKF